MVGDPIPLEGLIIDDTDDFSRGILYDEVSSRITHSLRELKIQADKLALEHTTDLQYLSTHKAERGYGLWQQVDWEAFGMVDVMQSEEKSLIAEGSLSGRRKNNQDQLQEPDNSAKTVKMSFSYGSGAGFVSRVRGYMNPTELMGFAASGLFKNGRILDETQDYIEDPFPVKWWKPFDGMSTFKAWNRL